MSQVICPLLYGREDLGNGHYHYYVTEGFYRRCVYCHTEVLIPSTTAKWREYESSVPC